MKCSVIIFTTVEIAAMTFHYRPTCIHILSSKTVIITPEIYFFGLERMKTTAESVTPTV